MSEVIVRRFGSRDSSTRSRRRPLSHPPWRLASGVNGESFAKRSNIIAHVLLDLIIAFLAILGECGENKSNELTNLLKFLNAESARGSGRGAKPNSRRNRWPFRIKRDAILIARKARAFECLFRRFAGDPDRSKGDNYDMAVCTAGDETRAPPGSPRCQTARVPVKSTPVAAEIR